VRLLSGNGETGPNICQTSWCSGQFGATKITCMRSQLCIVQSDRVNRRRIRQHAASRMLSSQDHASRLTRTGPHILYVILKQREDVSIDNLKLVHSRNSLVTEPRHKSSQQNTHLH
jgi:hypothetical protein